MRTYPRCSGALCCVAAVLVLACPALAQHEGMSHNMPAQAAPQGAVMGKMIAQKSVEGYSFMYHLLDLKERAALMKGMEGMEMPGMSKSPDVTNHLVVYIGGPDGKPQSGTVGFQVTGPDGKAQTTMTMGMQNGYGADVILKAKGAYAIKTKAVIGAKTLIDQLTYEVK